MMSAPDWTTCSTVSAFTVPAVPTGMNAGVRISPLGVVRTPARARPSLAEMRNGNAATLGGPPEQARIAVGIEPVTGRKRMRIGLAHPLETRKGGHQHEEGRARQMEVG